MLDTISVLAAQLIERVDELGPASRDAITDPAARFVTDRVVTTGDVPVNPATVTALRCALLELGAEPPAEPDPRLVELFARPRRITVDA